MKLTIRRADFGDPALRVFLEDHLKDMAPHAPTESQHALDLSALQEPTVRLWVATHGEGIAGTCALAALTADHEELKSMRTAPQLRGQGVAKQLLRYVLADAKARSVKRISLETGSMEFFAPARALYARSGFSHCDPFGAYSEDPFSNFMTRSL